jgi:molybdate transport system regulatory protein
MQTLWMASLQDVDPDIMPMFRRLTMKTSARNAFHGIVKHIEIGAVNAEVTIAMQGDDVMVATVTKDSIDRMQLAEGKPVWTLVKASWIILTADESAKTSARNRLCGTVSRVVMGPVNAEVVLQLDGGNTLAAVVTHDSATEMVIAKGQRLCALIKASHMLLGVDN